MRRGCFIPMITPCGRCTQVTPVQRSYHSWRTRCVGGCVWCTTMCTVPGCMYINIQTQEYGNTYKWMLYGDDDTIFFVDNVMRLLNDFNSSIPYFVTDHLWFTAKKKHAHPHPDAPRCLPCHFDLSSMWPWWWFWKRGLGYVCVR